jgi:hypothetical protein
MHFRCTAAHGHTTARTKPNNSSLTIAQERGDGPYQTRTQIQNQNQTKAHEKCSTRHNKRNLSSRKQCNDNNTLYPKTLTAERQYSQMRKMNQS